MRTRVVGALIVGCLLGTAASGAALAGAGHPRIVGGNVTADFPAVGEVLYSACGGTLIGCETILTSAHCALGDPSVFLRHLFFQHAGMVDVDLGASTLEIGYDMSVLKLASPVTRIRPLPINRITGSHAAPGAVVGWGCDPTLGTGESIKRAMPATVSDLYLTSVTAPVAGCSGDSGGAIVADLGSGEALAGVLSGTYGMGIQGPATWYYQSEIAQAAGPDLQSSSCGTGAQAGDPNSATSAFSGNISAETPQQTHTFSVPVGATELRVALNEEDNFNAFIRFGAPATTSTYDCRIDFNLSLSLSCTIPSPQPGAWHVLVNRVSGGGMYQLTATTFSDCTDPLNDGIACDDGNPCTDDDVCTNLACSGTTVADTTSCPVNADSQCTTGGSCQAGVCEATTEVDGSACTPPGADGECTSGGTCQAGSCEATIVEDGVACYPEEDPGSSGRCRDGSCQLACPSVPRTDCRSAGRSKFSLTRNDDQSRDKLQWSWSDGEAVVADDLGDPRSSTQYALCLYAADEQLRLTMAVPAGAIWKAQGSTPPKSFSFKDKSASSDGVAQLQVKTGVEGKASAKLRGEGVRVPNLTLPILQPMGMTVQLLNDEPVPQCWTAVYSGEAAKNDGKVLQLRLP